MSRAIGLVIVAALAAPLQGCELMWIPAYVAYAKCGTLKCPDKPAEKAGDDEKH